MNGTTAGQGSVVPPFTPEMAEHVVRADERVVLVYPQAGVSHRDMQVTRDVLALLPAGHPLAEVAGPRCAAEALHLRPAGAVACGACWEAAIRSDERVAVEENLTPSNPHTTPMPNYVDDIAVDRFLAGEELTLTASERVEAALRLAARCDRWSRVAARLRGTRTATTRLTRVSPARRAAATVVAGEAAEVA